MELRAVLEHKGCHIPPFHPASERRPQREALFARIRALRIIKIEQRRIEPSPILRAGGTLFLDEIDALPLTLQSNLLTVIEAKYVRWLGAVAEHAVDVNLIAATHADLYARLAGGLFRADLCHRLAVVLLMIPPLRERGEDIVLWA